MLSIGTSTSSKTQSNFLQITTNFGPHFPLGKEQGSYTDPCASPGSPGTDSPCWWRHYSQEMLFLNKRAPGPGMGRPYAWSGVLDAAGAAGTCVLCCS